MPSPKNLIDIKQLRQEQISGLALAVSSGFVVQYVSGLSGTLYAYTTDVSGYVDDVSGNLQGQLDTIFADGGVAILGFNVPISAGVDQVTCTYAQALGSTPVFSLGTTNTSDPMIYPMARISNTTGAVIDFSAPTPSANYYLNLLVPVSS